MKNYPRSIRVLHTIDVDIEQNIDNIDNTVWCVHARRDGITRLGARRWLIRTRRLARISIFAANAKSTTLE